MFLLLLFGEVQRQAQRLWQDVRLAGVLRQQGEVDQLLLPVNTESGNRKELEAKNNRSVTSAGGRRQFISPQLERDAEKEAAVRNDDTQDVLVRHM